MNKVKNCSLVVRNINTIINNLSNDKQDLLLIEWLKSLNVKSIPCRYQRKSFNRGDIVEYIIKKYIFNMKQGCKVQINNLCDMLVNGVNYEIKYIGANACSSGSKEHHKNKHIVVLNNGSEIKVIIVDYKDLIVDTNNHINYKNNYNKGKTILTYKA